MTLDAADLRTRRSGLRSSRSALVGAAVIVWLGSIVGCDRQPVAAFCPSKFMQKHDVAGFIAGFLAQEHITKPPSIERSDDFEALLEDPDREWSLVNISAEMEGGVEQASRLMRAYFDFVEKDLYAKLKEEWDARERAGKPPTGRHDRCSVSGHPTMQFFRRYGIGDNVGIFFSEVTTIDQGRIRLKVLICEERFD